MGAVILFFLFIVLPIAIIATAIQTLFFARPLSSRERRAIRKIIENKQCQ